MMPPPFLSAIVAALAMFVSTGVLAQAWGLQVKAAGTGQKGVEIAAVAPGSPAAAAELRAGDVILQVQGTPATDVAQVEGLLRAAPAGAALAMVVSRQGWSKELRLTPPVAPAPGPATMPPATMPAAATPPAATPPAATPPAATPPAATPPAATPAIVSASVTPVPSDPIAAMDRGNAAYDRGDWADAEASYKVALRGTADLPRLWGRLCHALVMQERFLEAAATCERAAELSPGEASAFQNVGYSFARLGRNGDAVQWFQRAAVVAPEWAPPRVGVAAAQFALGRYAEAETEYRLAVRFAPTQATAWQGLGDTCGELGKPADAVAAYEKALALGPGNAALYRSLGWQLYLLRRTADAGVALEQSSKLAPADVITLVLLGVVQEQLGRPADARASWERAIQLDPGGELGALARGNLEGLPGRLAAPQSAPPALTVPLAGARRVDAAPTAGGTSPPARTPSGAGPETPASSPPTPPGRAPRDGQTIIDTGVETEK